LLEHLAADEPILVAIDDVQWLDRSSSSGLSFALRRLDTPLVLLLARRLAQGMERPSSKGRSRPTPSDTCRLVRWAGLHYRTADIQAEILGRNVADYTAENYFQPVGRRHRGARQCHSDRGAEAD
jgi:hypothetical protein